MTTLEQNFHNAMIGIYHEAKTIGYTASYFMQMLDRDRGLVTAKKLINSTEISHGYSKLWELGRLDLTVEALVYENPEWHPLFTAEEIEKCRERLEEFKYEFKS